MTRINNKLLTFFRFIRRGYYCPCGGKLKEIEGWNTRECIKCHKKFKTFG